MAGCFGDEAASQSGTAFSVMGVRRINDFCRLAIATRDILFVISAWIGGRE